MLEEKQCTLCALFLASLDKNSITTFEITVIQVVENKLRLLHLLQALYSDLNDIYPTTVFIGR